MAAKSRPAYKGGGYWAVQFGFCAFMVAVSAFGVVAIAREGGPDAAGQALILGVVALLFLGVLIWLLVMFFGQTAQQRAVQAWAIMQQHTSSVDHVTAMRRAGDARRGELSRAEIDELQALRPEVPYPGTLPHA